MSKLDENNMESESTSSADLNRRRVLKAVGGAAIGFTAAAGTASAHKIRWYGCSQVCISTDAESGNKVVIATEDGFECRDDFEGRRERQDIPNKNTPGESWTGGKHCLEVDDGEAIVGVCEEGENFTPNPNRCADNYLPDNYDSFDCEACKFVYE